MASTLDGSSSSSSSSSSNSDAYLGFLEQAKQKFWMTTSHLSEEQRNQLWFQAACQPTQPSMAHQVPRSMTFDPSSMMELPVWNQLWSALPSMI